MLYRAGSLISRLSRLMGQVGPAIEADLADAIKNDPLPPAGCETLRLNAEFLNRVIGNHVGCVVHGGKVRKIRYVLEPGKGIEVIVYYEQGKPK